MYTRKLKIKTSSVNVWRSLCWWPGLSYCLVTSSISQGRPQKKCAGCNCWDDSEARREDLGWQSEGVVWRWHRIQTGRGRRGTGVLGCADSWTPWGRAWMQSAPVHCSSVCKSCDKPIVLLCSHLASRWAALEHRSAWLVKSMFQRNRQS